MAVEYMFDGFRSRSDHGRVMATPPGPFRESSLWSTPIRDLGLTIEGTRLEPILQEYRGHIEGFDRADILRYLRHGMGHVANYAYRLYEDEEWILRFGSITQ